MKGIFVSRNSKLFFKLTCLIALGAFTLVSCDKKDMGSPDDSSLKFSQSDIEMIGVKHNEFVSKTIDRINAGALIAVEAQLESTYEQFGKEQGIQNYDINTEKLAGPNDLYKKLQTKEAQYFFDKVMYTLSGSDNYRDISARLASIADEASSKISNSRDRQAILIFATVSEKSAQLWLSKNTGGMGYLDVMKSKIQQDRTARGAELRKVDPCIGDVLAADGAGAATQFLAWGFAIAVPGVNIAIAGEIAFASGAASIWSYFTSKNCFPDKKD